MTRRARYFAPKIRYCTRKIKKKKNNVATRESPCTSKTFYDIDFTPAALVCTRLIKTTISAMTKQIIEMTMNMILIIYRRIDQISWEE